MKASLEYAFDSDKAKSLRHVDVTGNTGIYVGEYQGNFLIYDLDMGELFLQKNLGRSIRKSQPEDYDNWVSTVTDKLEGMDVPGEMIGRVEEELYSFIGDLEELEQQEDA